MSNVIQFHPRSPTTALTRCAAGFEAATAIQLALAGFALVWTGYIAFAVAAGLVFPPERR